MKSKGKLFKKFGRKISIFSTVMLILQPLLMVAVTPTQTFAASGEFSIQPAIQDARVEEGDPDNNLNTTVLKVKSGVGDNKISYIQFDLSDLPANSTINSATLNLYMFDAPGVSRYYALFRAANTWFEDTITWNNQPLVTGDPTSVVPTGVVNDTWLSWDVTNDVLGFLNGTFEKNGWLIFDDELNSETGREAQFRSSNYSDELSLRPTLLLDITADPTSNITSPDADTTYNATTWPGEISGISSTPIEGASIETVEVAISDGTNYWNWGEGGEGLWNSVEPVWQATILDEETGEWSYGFTPDKDGVFTIKSRATDSDGDQEADDMIENVTYDGTAPTFESMVTPATANQNNKTVEIEITPSEELREQDVPVGVLNQRVIALGPTYSVKLTINENPEDPLVVYLPKDAEGKYRYTYAIESTGEKTIPIEMIAMDLAGNSGTGNSSFTLDNVAPGKVADLKAVAGDGKIDLSWTNPTDADLANIQIIRNGTVLATLAKTVTTYSDTAVTNGTAYTYDVYAIDTAGNRSEKVSVNVTPVAPVVTAVATSEVTSAITTETIKPADEGEIKAEVKEAEEEEPKKDTEVKEDKKIPVWGILFLLILAAIGGYLFYVQNPERFSSLNGKR